MKKITLAVSFLLAAFSVATQTSASIFSSTSAPARADNGPDSSVELGVTFQSSVAGTITGVRFYKSAANIGTHVGNLWSITGANLATATFTGETASGWQQVLFSAPVTITAGTTYVASYHSAVGHFAADLNYFSTEYVSGQLTATGSVYVYGGGAFPASTYAGTNYWVDVVFVASGGGTSPFFPSKIILSWNGGRGVTWNLYRSTVSGGPYTKIASGLNSPSYLDTAIMPNVNYYYVTTSVDASGRERLFRSNSKTVTASMKNLALAFCFFILALNAPCQTLLYHNIQLDSSGKIIPWLGSPDTAYDQVISADKYFF